MKGIIYILIYLFFSTNFALSFTSNPDTKDIKTGGREDHSFINSKNSNFKKGDDALKRAIKYLNKDKNEKAKKFLEKSLSYFLSANNETPNNTNVLNLLGFVYSLEGDLIMSEIYYLEGLNVDPNNRLINKGLGQLYFNTKRVNLAKERLKVLEKCNCREFFELKEIMTKINN